MEKSVHRVIFENSTVRHLRCKSCDVVHVCATKGSFQARVQPLPFAELIALATQGGVEPYSIRRDFHPTDVFSHPKFGAGYVCAILSPPQKMEALFEDKLRVLVCGPGSSMPEPIVVVPPAEDVSDGIVDVSDGIVDVAIDEPSLKEAAESAGLADAGADESGL